MYGLPPDFDASVFVGTELTQVSFSVNTVHLVLEPGVWISIEASFSVQVGAGAPFVTNSPPVESSELMALIGKKVRAAAGSVDGTLTLTFENGGTVVCLDDSDGYESYTVHARGKTFIV